MAKITSKLQVTVPKAIADRYGIRPGDQVEWTPAGEGIRVTRVSRRGRDTKHGIVARRLRLFDQATERQRSRAETAMQGRPARDRGWTREDLYRRGGAG
jgi:AbrB family looped-hinge helix DNA binding protein